MSKKKIIQRVVVGGVMLYRNKVLLLQRSNNEEVYPNLWELPSGKKEIGETCLESIIREFREETGIKVNPVSVVGVFDYTIVKANEIREVTQINFIVKPCYKKINVKLSCEHSSYKFFNNNEYKKIYCSDKTKKIIQQTYKQIIKR